MDALAQNGPWQRETLVTIAVLAFNSEVSYYFTWLHFSARFRLVKLKTTAKAKGLWENKLRGAGIWRLELLSGSGNLAR